MDSWTHPGSRFLTGRAAARHMVPRRRSAIVFLSASLTGQFIPFVSGIVAACGAVSTIAETTANMAGTMGVERDEASRPTTINVLRRPLRVEGSAATVAWVASDFASGVAGQVIKVCAGAIVSR